MARFRHHRPGSGFGLNAMRSARRAAVRSASVLRPVPEVRWTLPFEHETRPLRVLIADDHAPTRRGMRRALDADKRFDVCAEVADAAGAVQAAVRNRPDVCLLDTRMPGSGLAAAWEIAARLPRAKIVMLTVSDEDADLSAALRAGADGYLVKTTSMRRVPDALHDVCRTEAGTPRSLVARVLERFMGGSARTAKPPGQGPRQEA